MSDSPNPETLHVESSDASTSLRPKRSYNGILEAETSDTPTEVNESIKSRKVGFMSHRAPPDPTLHDQKRMDQLMDQAEVANLKGRYADSVKIYLQLLDFYSAEMARCESKNGTTSRGPHTGWILSCFNLTRCYLSLKQPQAASDILQQAWNPDSSLVIPPTHPKYLELSHLYFEVEESCKTYPKDIDDAVLFQFQQASDIPQDVFTIKDVLDLMYMYAQDFMSQDQSQDAILILKGGISRAKEAYKTYDKNLKGSIVKIHLFLAEVYLHVGQLKAGQEVLKQIWNSESQFHINSLDDNYLWLSQLYRRATYKEKCDTTSCRHQVQKRREPTHYERLAVAPTAIPAQIKSHWRTCMLYFHPDKGGHTGVAQEMTAAAKVLLDPESRRQYDAKIHAI
ncbi:hypothetical protein DFH28DRAFT_884046 [Melampsora americana]|nr:hypothetical protein DFH28DRAFT_915259 [Melampsora americana]KAH9818331.1 hypothetical protein DFH28DRAFT_888327 [Melampsora americana]KAH9820470.1 hypothetical protein DFH28DRAFT_884046 [Melampsora americana]